MSHEKPKILYHGSPHKHIEELEPRNQSVRDPEEGPLVFATPDFALATIFMARDHVSTGRFNDIRYVVILGSQEDFVSNDNGGHIYVLPSEGFENDPNKGLGKYEWTNKNKVIPQDKIEFHSTLDAMIDNGVQVYFVDEETKQKIKESKDDGFSILQNLTSENQRRGVNVKSLA